LHEKPGGLENAGNIPDRGPCFVWVIGVRRDLVFRPQSYLPNFGLSRNGKRSQEKTMSKVSKTAKASEVKETKTAKAAIPDHELVRLLRIDRASGLYPSTQGADALLREYDAIFQNHLDTQLSEVTLQRQLDAIDHDLSDVLGERAEDDVTSVLARVQLALRKVREDVKERAAHIVKTKDIILVGSPSTTGAADVAYAEGLSAAVQAL
jgi:hypothetical protein